jgi:hypothetical protein
MEMRQAVVPNGILCASGKSAGGAETVPQQQVSFDAGSMTKGAFNERRIVSGKLRLRSRPAQNGHRHLVTPSLSGPACLTRRQRALLLNGSS